MSIRQLPAPCWTIRWNGDTEPTGHHYATREAVLPGRAAACVHLGCGGIVAFGPIAWCISCEEENIPDEDWEERPFTPVQLTTPCWVASCDTAGCDPGLLLGQEEAGYGIHQDTRDAFTAQYIASLDWQVTRDGQIRCPDHVPLTIRIPVMTASLAAQILGRDAPGSEPQPGPDGSTR